MDIRKYWFGQYVTDSQMDDAFDQVQEADQRATVAVGLSGVTSGLGVAQHYVGTFASPNLTVDAAAGVAHLADGSRVVQAATGNVNCAVDYLGASTAVTSPGQWRGISVFCRPLRVLSEPHAKKSGPPDVYRIQNESCEFIVKQGAEGGIPVYPALDPTMVLLADIPFNYGKTQITTANIVTDRRQDAVVIAGTPHAVRENLLTTAVSNILGWLNGHLAGSTDKHAATVVTTTAISGSPDNLGYTGTFAVGGTVQGYFSSLLGYLNALINRLVATGAVDTGVDGAGYVGAEAVAGTPKSLTVGSVGSQLVELLGYENAWYKNCRVHGIYGPGVVEWNAEDYDTDSMWSTAARDKVYINTPGKYHINAAVQWTASGTGTRLMQIYVKIGASPETALEAGSLIAPSSAGTTTDQQISADYYFPNAGDYFRISTSGAPANLADGYCSAHRIG